VRNDGVTAMRGKWRRPGWDEGTTAVEAAITFSLLFALVFGIIEFGMALWQSNTMALAIEEAGRYVMLNNTSCNTASCAETQLKNTLSAYGGIVTSANSGICTGSPPNLAAPSAGSICVYATAPTGASPQTMTLTAIYAYSNIIVPSGHQAGILAGPFKSTSQATFPLD
jgi:Flp pilus assembly protein TadG